MKSITSIRSTILGVTLLAGYLNVACGAEEDSPPASSAPSGLACRALAELDPPAIHVTWRDTKDEAGYAIERKADGEAFAEIARTPFNITQLHDTPVLRGGTYVYRVAGVDDQGSLRSYSAEVTVQVPE